MQPRCCTFFICPMISRSREMIGLVRVGSVEGWDRLIAAVEEALHLGVTDAAAVLHIFHMPDDLPISGDDRAGARGFGGGMGPSHSGGGRGVASGGYGCSRGAAHFSYAR